MLTRHEQGAILMAAAPGGARGDSYPQLTCLFLHAGVEGMTAAAYTT
ncbi:hypothetical protein [Sinorhizobium medicae]|nr:hypothetical protein [Sinorhizobium medicae]